jgi:hypothetical protein
MRTEFWKAVSAMCLVLVVAGWGGICAAEVAEEKATLAEPPPETEGQMWEGLSGSRSEWVERMLAEIRREDPAKADELVRLREEDPNAFRMAIRRVMRERFRNRMREERDMPGRRYRGPEGPTPAGPGPEPFREQIQEKSEEYIKWLIENYPDEAAKLEQLKEENPAQYMRALRISRRKYDRIFRTSKDNPQLATVLKEQMTLREKRGELLQQIKATTDEKQKKELTAELQNVVSRQFDLIVKRKQLAYEDLANKLAKLQKEVDRKKTEVEKWKSKDFKNEQVKKRVDELIGEKEKFEWE